MVGVDMINSSIDRFGEDVSLIVASSTTYSDWGDRSQTTSSSTITTIHNDIQGDEEFNKDGRYEPGDKVFFAKGSTTGLSPGNKVVFDSETYEIKDSITHNIKNENKVHEIRCGKV